MEVGREVRKLKGFGCRMSDVRCLMFEGTEDGRQETGDGREVRSMKFEV
jgi:hypothetical protein